MPERLARERQPRSLDWSRGTRYVTAMRDFWRSSGFHLLLRNVDGRLVVTDGFLRAYFRRPELQPVEESCAAEIRLHQALLHNPRRTVTADQLKELADPDARENYQVVLSFRDLLIAAGTVETCYINLFRGERVTVPPLFIDQMTRVILRNILEGCDDPIQVRAAELLFRSQKVGLPEGAIMLADEEYSATGGFGDLGRLVALSQTPMRSVELDVLNEDNGTLYWQRDERHDTVLDFSFGRPGVNAMCRVLEAWARHFFDVEVAIEPVDVISDERWVWHIGLDAEATAILNDLYDGKELEDERRHQLLALFRLEFRDPALMQPAIAGRPVYLGMAMTSDNVLRMKPQNLLVNLPLAESA